SEAAGLFPMSKRDAKRLPHDFHLWTHVAETVEPLRRKGLLKLGAGPLPVPESEPIPEIKAPPKKLGAGRPFLPPYQAPPPGGGPGRDRRSRRRRESWAPGGPFCRATRRPRPAGDCWNDRSIRPFTRRSGAAVSISTARSTCTA